MKLLKHKHQWVTVYRGRKGQVDKCADCKEYQSTLVDYAQNKLVTLPGNLLAPMLHNRSFYVISGTHAEFIKAQQLLRMRFELDVTQIVNVYDANILTGLEKPDILLYGTWWENEEVIQHPAFLKVVNQWLDD